jgi:RNA polymerase sigma-70 factor (ECF subfamily)
MQMKKQDNAHSQDVWQDFNGRLRAFVSKRVKQPADAEDVVQEIFVRIHRNLSTIQDETRLAAWTFAIARNAIADHFRDKGKPTDPLPDDFDVPIDSNEDDEAAVSELSKCLEPMIGKLPDSYREAINLTELRGMTQLEAAAHAGLSLSGMKARVQRGRGKLRDMLLQCCAIESDRRGGIVQYHPRRGHCNPCATGQQDCDCKPLLEDRPDK